jgi:hypothetical protein
VLDGVHAHRAFADCGRAFDRLHIRDRGVDCWLVLQIFALEFDPGIRRRRLNFSETREPVWREVPLNEAALARVC